MRLAIGDEEILILVEGPAEKFWVERKFGVAGAGDPLIFHKVQGPNGEVTFKATPKPVKTGGA